MIVSRREIAKFAVFVVLVGLTVFYVAANLERITGIFGERASPGETVAGTPEPDGERAIPVTGLSDQALTLIESFGSPAQDFFIEFRMEREQARSAQLELLREVLGNAGLSQEARDRTLAVWLEITESIAQEVDIENLIRAKGYSDAVVVLSGGKATILVKAAALTREDVIRIADLVVRVAGLRYEDISVAPRDG